MPRREIRVACAAARACTERCACPHAVPAECVLSRNVQESILYFAAVRNDRPRARKEISEMLGRGFWLCRVA